MPDVDFITVDSADYPRTLKKPMDRPPFLFMRGKIHESDRLSLAIVGTREPSHHGLQLLMTLPG